MNGRETWLGAVAAAGIVTMLLFDGALDAAGLALAIAPLAYASIALVRGALRDQAARSRSRCRSQRGAVAPRRRNEP